MYQLARKAYWVGKVGEETELVVFVSPDEDRNQAKVKFQTCPGGRPDLKYIDIKATRCRESDLYLHEGIERTTAEIKKVEDTKKWRRQLNEFVARNKGRKVRIYSRQYSLYWRENAFGCTNTFDEAGIYSILKAYDHVKDCGVEKGIELHLVENDISLIDNEIKKIYSQEMEYKKKPWYVRTIQFIMPNF